MIDVKETINKLSLPGSVWVMPTDTVYGLVCRINDKKAVQKLYKLKDREHKPGTVIACSIDQLTDFGLKKRYLKAVSQYWPGPVSVIIPLVNNDLSYLTLGLASLAIRIPNNDQLLAILEATGPLLTTSANLPTQPPANTILEARQYFEDRVDGYIDGGDRSNSLPSTIIQVVDDEIVVLRQGSVKI